MEKDKLDRIVRALAGVPQGRLAVVQQVVNKLSSTAEHGDKFQADLSRFLLTWKPVVAPTPAHGTPDFAAFTVRPVGPSEQPKDSD